MGNTKAIPARDPNGEIIAQVGYHNEVRNNVIVTNIGIISWCMVTIIIIVVLVGAIITVRYCVKCFNKRVERGIEAGMVRMQRIQK